MAGFGDGDHDYGHKENGGYQAIPTRRDGRICRRVEGGIRVCQYGRYS
jgi:hypothetical protein